MAVINSMSLRGKITLAACGLGFFIAVALIFKMATAPSYVTVMSGIDPTKGAEINSALSASGVTGNLTAGGTQLQVPKGQEDQAVTALAQKGLNSTQTQMGFKDTLDKQKLGASSIQQKVAYQRGLEGEIAAAIGKIEGVGQPNVRLTLPDQTAFVGAEDQPTATAAVVLGSSAAALAPGAVRGIANIVASSVPSLTAQRVTITDDTMREGLQIESPDISVDDKLRLLDALIGAGAGRAFQRPAGGDRHLDEIGRPPRAEDAVEVADRDRQQLHDR